MSDLQADPEAYPDVLTDSEQTDWEEAVRRAMAAEVRVAELEAQLEGDVLDALDFLWREYVQADPATLTEDAKELAAKVRQRVRVLAGVERLEAECDALRGRLAEADARVASLETEVDRHRERANAAALAWEGHQVIDCAIKCAREIEELLGTNDPVQAARAIKTLQTERDGLKARLAEVEAQAAAMRGALEDVDAVHRSALGQANERGDNLTPLQVWSRVRNALSLSAGAELAKKVERLEARVDEMRKTLMLCSLLFGDIMDDYTDPRDKCRKGQQLIEIALSSQEASAGDDLQGLRQAN